MKTRLLAVLSFLFLFTASCKKEQQEAIHEPKVINLPVRSAEVISKSNNFGITLFTKTAKIDNGNIMLSPLSASAALTMLLNGCRNSTFTQIQQMLGYEGMVQTEINAVYKSLTEQLLTTDSQVKLAIANSIWYRKGFEVKSPFLEAMDSDFSAHIEALDFSLPSALTTMNQWASSNTYGKITKVLTEISPDAMMFLMNALYFKGTWTTQFEKSKTNNEIFYLEGGSTANVTMMHSSINAKVVTSNNYKAIELFYGRTNFSMIIIVPNITLTDFCETFNKSEWETISSSFNSQVAQGKWVVSLPRFKFSYEKSLKDQLISMGMVDAFDSTADLSGISDEGLLVTLVKQNTYIDVNEEGTEAAAVTTIGVGITSNIDTNVFKVDKPFIFAIRERTTNTILFMGKVVNPSL